jgi:energy-coupling factor transporter transmembrane protein EcfT
MMKAVFPEPVHESYKRHRKQRTSQIILPAVLVTLIFIALVVLVILATANGTGDVGRWAAVSTIWISIPVCAMGLVFLALLGGMVYLMGRLLGVAPRYTGEAQNFVHKLAIRIRRAADTAVKPVFAVNGFGATIRALLGRK